MKEYYRVQANINLDAICNNLLETRKLIKKETKIMAIIKADGYGHGAIPLAKTIDEIVDAYGIAILEEGIELRKAGITKPILILGFTPAPLYEKLVEYDISQTVFQYDMAKKLSEVAIAMKRKAKIHIKLDTGMGRIGFGDNKESVKVIQDIADLDGIEIVGLFTHFACADETDKTSVCNQYHRFIAFAEQLEQKGIHIPIKHVSNSAAIIDLPQANLDMVRSGISTYGLYPSEEVDKKKIVLQPAMEIKSMVSYVKEVEAGTGISYGSTYVTKGKTKVATIPVGYADGYPRALSSRGRVLIHGISAPIIGRVCMDQFMVDVTHIDDVEEGDTVTLIGADGDNCITVEELSALAYSFNYEFVCDINKRIPRVYYKDGIKIGTLDFYNCFHKTLEFMEIDL